ncbi:BrnA antitoxin family protein [Nitrincola alkalilacustris]|uniref:BrnA antitoxin family protein n=1 Tax=Nitrincola alkalilacustris TaxID=1571224 RepID=UPI00124CCE03|nr:BrnA antitoxin family protein [Nitrincola alkalilacustris]
MPKLKEGTLVPTPEEDARINAGIAADPDTHEVSDSEFKRMKPMGRPKAEITKERITVRLSPDVLSVFKATGKGWQTRMDRALKEYVQEHSQDEIQRL